MATENHNYNSGIGFTGALTILFVGLKLTNIINWSWWWVLSPVWISFLFALVLLVGVGIFILYSEVKGKK